MTTQTLADITAQVQSGIVLQAAERTQQELFQFIHENALLASSLWVNVALAGLATLVFILMGRSITDSRAQLIWVATMLVPLVSLSSYTGLVSGLTVGFIEMPAGHALAGQEVFVPWGRYLTWGLSTPAILLALGLVAGSDVSKLFTATVSTAAMCFTGLAAALITSSHLLRWVFFVISSAFFVVVLAILLVEWPADAERTGSSEIFTTLRNLTVVLWLAYPIVWALSADGIAVIADPALTSWAYSALDIVAKYVFAFLLLRWVAANERVVADSAAGATSGAAPADD